MRHTLLFLLFAFAPLALASDTWDSHLIVDPKHPKASHVRSPFKTLQSAGDKALQNALQGKSTRIKVASGIYRERLTLNNTHPERPTAPILIEGIKNHTILSGVSPKKGWKLHRDNYFQLHTPNTTPRMIFVEGIRLKQVIDPRHITGGTFFQTSNTLLLLPPKYGHIKEDTVEIDRQSPFAIHAKNLSNIQISHITIEKGYRVGILLQDIEHAVLQDVHISYQHHVALKASHIQQLHIQNSTFKLQGKNGVDIHTVQTLLLQNVDINLNGWRWAEDPQKDPADKPIALKLTSIPSFEAFHLTLNENRGNAIVSYDTKGSVKESVMIGNFGKAIHAQENSSLAIEDTMIAMQHEEATLSQTSTVILQNNILYDNGKSEQHPQINALTGYITLQNNIIESVQGQASLIVATLDNYTGNHNLFYAPRTHPFMLSDTSLSFLQWQQRTRADTQSLFAPPKLENPASYEFLPTSQSPWFLRKHPQ